MITVCLSWFCECLSCGWVKPWDNSCWIIFDSCDNKSCVLLLCLAEDEAPLIHPFPAAYHGPLWQQPKRSGPDILLPCNIFQHPDINSSREAEQCDIRIIGAHPPVLLCKNGNHHHGLPFHRHFHWPRRGIEEVCQPRQPNNIPRLRHLRVNLVHTWCSEVLCRGYGWGFPRVFKLCFRHRVVAFRSSTKYSFYLSTYPQSGSVVLLPCWTLPACLSQALLSLPGSTNCCQQNLLEANKKFFPNRFMQPLKLQPFWPPATCLRVQETLVTTKLPLLIAWWPPSHLCTLAGSQVFAMMDTLTTFKPQLEQHFTLMASKTNLDSVSLIFPGIH